MIDFWLRFYRVRGWKNRVTWLKPTLYSFLAYSMIGLKTLVAHNTVRLILLNSIVVAGIAMFSYSLNDFFNAKKEKSFIGEQIRKKNISSKQAYTLCFIPLVVVVGALISLANVRSAVLVAVLVLFSFMYSSKSFGLKNKKYGWFVLPLSATILFLESYFIFVGFLTTNILFLSVIIFLFACYMEVHHIIVDQNLGEMRVLPSKMAKNLLFTFPRISILFSIIFSFYSPIFLATTVFSVVRLFSLRRIREKDLTRIRLSSTRPFLSPTYSCYEFLVYGLFGLAGWMI